MINYTSQRITENILGTVFMKKRNTAK